MLQASDYPVNNGALKRDVNKTCVHPTQLPRKPETKEVDVSYGKKVKDTSSRAKTSKEEWKEREASANQTVPTRVKIFEGGSVQRSEHFSFFTARRHKTCSFAPCLVKNIV